MKHTNRIFAVNIITNSYILLSYELHNNNELNWQCTKNQIITRSSINQSFAYITSCMCHRHMYSYFSLPNIMIENIFVRVNIKFTTTVPLQIFLFDSYHWYAIFASLNTTTYISASKQMTTSQTEQQDTINYASTGL